MEKKKQKLIVYVDLGGYRFYLFDEFLTPFLSDDCVFDSYDLAIRQIKLLQSKIKLPFTICNYDNYFRKFSHE